MKQASTNIYALLSIFENNKIKSKPQDQGPFVLALYDSNMVFSLLAPQYDTF